MPVPAFFKAAVLPSPGARHIVTTRSLSALAPDEVAIKITATAINPADWKFRDLDQFIPEYPAVLGSDAAGEIAAAGANVTDFVVGDRVFFQGIILGAEAPGYQSSTFQQYCRMPARLIAKTPGNISDEEAAGIQLATMAAVTALYDNTGYGLPAPWDEGGRTAGMGNAIVIIGGSSSVGQYAIQLARLSGFDRIVTSASSRNARLLESLGAHVVLDRETQSRPEDFYHALDDCPLSLVFDPFGGLDTQLVGVKLLQLAKGPNATYIRPCGCLLEDLPSLVAGKGHFNPPEVVRQSREDPKVEIKATMGVGSFPQLRYLSEPMQKHLGGEDGYIARGLFRPNRPAVVPGGLGVLDTALARNKEGVSGKKLVIRPFE